MLMVDTRVMRLDSETEPSLQTRAGHYPDVLLMTATAMQSRLCARVCIDSVVGAANASSEG